MSNSTFHYPIDHTELKVLILEDNPEDASVLQRQLKKDFQDCQCIVAEDEHQFRDALSDFSPDAVVADNSSLNFDAGQVLQAVRKNNKQTVFIMVTGLINEEQVKSIIREGGDDYIIKDRLSNLSVALNAALLRRAQHETKRRALERLARRLEKYKTLVNTISDGLMAIDAEGYITYMNESAGKLLSKNGRTPVGNIIWDAFPELNGSAFQQLVQDTLRSDKQGSIQDHFNNSKKWVESNVYPSQGGATIHLKDITREREEHALALQAETRYTKFINRISEAFVSFDRDWRYTFVNAKAAKLTNMSRDELIGRNVWEMFPAAIGSATYEAFQQAIHTQEYVCNEDYYAPLDLWQENHIYPSADGLSVFIRDISGQKKMEIELKKQEMRSQREMIAASLAAEEKERNMIGKELHDNVNQLPASTNLFLSVIRDSPERVDELVPLCIDTIKKAIQENRRIAHELVAPDLETKNLAAQVSDLFDTMLKPAGIATSLNMDEEDEWKLSAGQKLAIYRILQEQCSNILKYSGASQVSLDFNVGKSVASMSIADNGRGTDPAVKSQGIGLKNIASRVKVLEGEMKVDTSPGAGFKLEISIPLVSSGPS
ncbi:MAG: PAS domain-containing protein [Chitinophagaceae bacterium]